MGKPIKILPVSNTALATSSNPITTNTVNSTFNQGFPTGNALMHDLHIRYSGNLNLTSSGAGSITTRGGLQNIRGLWIQTPQHGLLVNGLDGIHMHTLMYLRNRVRPTNVDISSAASGTPTYEYYLGIPFRDKAAARPNDGSIDLFKLTYMEARLSLGAVQNDFITGGTYSTIQNQAANWDMVARVDPGPVAANDVPLFKPYYDILKFPVNQTITAQAIFLPYGGRLVRKYLISQRNSSSLAELANTVIGANDTDRVSLLVATYPWVARVEWLHLQDMNSSDLQLTGAMPTGSACLSFAQPDSRGYLASEILGLNNAEGATPQVELDLDVTSVTNGSIHVVTDALTPIPVDAVRPQAQAAQA